MQSKLLHEKDGKRTFALILETGDEAMACLQQFAVRERLAASQITAIGAMSSATLAFFDWESKTYRPIPVNEQVEVASLVGDIALGPDQDTQRARACGARSPRRRGDGRPSPEGTRHGPRSRSSSRSRRLTCAR